LKSFNSNDAVTGKQVMNDAQAKINNAFRAMLLKHIAGLSAVMIHIRIKVSRDARQL
jgi:hypothetical protein